MPTAPNDTCLSGTFYTAKAGDSCDTIATTNSLASAALYMANQEAIRDCTAIPAGVKLCLPASCDTIYELQNGDSCRSIEQANATGAQLRWGDVRKYNPWISLECDNLQAASNIAYGHILCLSPQNGIHNSSLSGDSTTVPAPADGYGTAIVEPPAGVTVAQGTTLNCAKWHVVVPDDTCVVICMADKTTVAIFMQVNPSLGTVAGDCTNPKYQRHRSYINHEHSINNHINIIYNQNINYVYNNIINYNCGASCTDRYNALSGRDLWPWE
ncbi:hypothetical protein GQ53DRAFT_824588 [Thozetella sp. PMI_491]|nr:hypothetical protein GQ53DRAFT_824588 [Thozetella sp. PMI_491]